MATLTMRVASETLRLAQPFRISGYVFESSDVVVVSLHDGQQEGRGEGGGVYYLGDDVPHMLVELEAARTAIEAAARARVERDFGWDQIEIGRAHV